MKKRKFAIHEQTNASGSTTFVLDMGKQDGKRLRKGFPTRAEARTYGLQWEVAKKNEGLAAFTLPLNKRTDAAKAIEIVGPDVSLTEIARYYRQHVLAYKTAPDIKTIIERYISDGKAQGNRPRTVDDKEDRLNIFAEDFGTRRLSDLSVEELADWLADDDWAARTRINYRTKISQLYNFALKRKWVDSNIASLIDNPTVDETTPEIFTVDECAQLLEHANEFGLLPYIALGLFAGIRVAELGRLDAKHINFETKTIRLDADVAKTRAKRTVDMQPALIAFLEPMKEEMAADAVIVKEKHRYNIASLIEAVKTDIPDFTWKANGLRHSFGSYHYAMFESAEKTSYQMGNSPDVLHKHYKALVTKAQAEAFWKLRPAKV